MPAAYTDSNWVGNTKNHRSVTGYAVYMAGRPILYKSCLQPTVTLSSTEAEFVAANDTGKSIIYIQSILDELGIELDEATEMFIDNAGARLMGNSHKPTKGTRHLAVKYFALLQWTECDFIVLKPVSTHDNNSDILTKALGKQLYNCHKAVLMGHKPPNYNRYPT